MEKTPSGKSSTYERKEEYITSTNTITLPSVLVWSLVISLFFTVVIFLSAPKLKSFSIIGPSTPFNYPWRLKSPNFWTHFSSWSGYLLHNLIVWVLISFAQSDSSSSQKPIYSIQLQWFNWAMIITHVCFFIVHLIQTHTWYDGLAQDVPEITALGSVAFMLMVVLILETPRRGLILGYRPLSFSSEFLSFCRQYHGYIFSWATIYTFWYHPMEDTLGHLSGFFYMFVLFAQSALLFNRAHLNRWWTTFLEVFVLIHGVLVAMYQNNLWPMFAFGFGAMFVLSQMYGLGFTTKVRQAIIFSFTLLSVLIYWRMGRLSKLLDEVSRIPILDYMVVVLLWAIFIGYNKVSESFGFKKSVETL